MTYLINHQTQPSHLVRAGADEQHHMRVMQACEDVDLRSKLFLALRAQQPHQPGTTSNTWEHKQEAQGSPREKPQSMAATIVL